MAATAPKTLKAPKAPKVRVLNPRDPAIAFGDVLHRVALTVNSSLDLKEILDRLAHLTLEAIPADHCSVFLIDSSGSRLVPTLSIGKVADPPLWQHFRTLEPVDLMEVAGRSKAFRVGRAVGIPDMLASPFIPPEFVDIFRARSAMLVPLFAGGEALGLLTLDWSATRQDFPDEELTLGESIGVYAALAIRNARLYQGIKTKARALERVVEVAGALNSVESLRSVLDLICESFEELLKTNHCSVNLIDESLPSGIRTLAARGVGWFTWNRENLRAVSRDELARVRTLWERSAEPVVYPDVDTQGAVDRSLVPDPVRAAALFPLHRSGALVGFVVTGFAATGGPDDEGLAAGLALCEQATTALQRAALHEDLSARLQETEILYRLSDVVAGTSDLNQALRGLNRILRPELGVTLRSISVADSRAREAVGAATPDKEEMEAIRSWRAVLAKGRIRPSPKRTEGGLLVPVVHRSRVQGAIRATSERELESSGQALLGVVASGCAQVIYKAGLRNALATSERHLTIAAERERMAQDLHDSVGQTLTGIGLRLGQCIAQAPEEAARLDLEDLYKLAKDGNNQVRRAIHSLLFLQVRRRGLARCLRELASKFQATTGIAARLAVKGQPNSLALAKEDVIFRAAHEGLMNVERHSQASSVALLLAYEPDNVTLVVRDDGVGLKSQDPFAAKGGHFGLSTMRRMVEEAGGSIDLQDAAPRGVSLKVQVLVRNTKGR